MHPATRLAPFGSAALRKSLAARKHHHHQNQGTIGDSKHGTSSLPLIYHDHLQKPSMPMTVATHPRHPPGPSHSSSTVFIVPLSLAPCRTCRISVFSRRMSSAAALQRDGWGSCNERVGHSDHCDVFGLICMGRIVPLSHLDVRKCPQSAPESPTSLPRFRFVCTGQTKALPIPSGSWPS